MSRRSRPPPSRAPSPAAPTPATPRAAGERLEVWAVLGYGVAALSALALLYLGLRPGGTLPIFVWGPGRDLLQLVALALLVTGAIWSARRRPFLRRRRKVPFLLLALVVGLGAYPFPYPSSHEGHESSVCFRLPFAAPTAGGGEWTVFWGGEKKETSLLAAYSADRRFGLDFVVAKDGRTHAGEGSAASDYYCFGRDVLAPAAGTVVRAVGDVEDGAPGAADRRTDGCGNHVVLRVGEREFVFLCHLQQGSLAVSAGQSVEPGDSIGRVGSSGWSAFTPQPHLAVHLQDTEVAGKGEPIPWRFCGYLADGAPLEKGLPHGGIASDGGLLGQRVEPARVGSSASGGDPRSEK